MKDLTEAGRQRPHAMSMSSRTPSSASIRATSLLILFVAGIVLLRSLPLETALLRLEGEARAMGGLSLAVYGGGYTLAALAFVPGAALTLGAGAVFGLWRGVAVVSLASTAAAALAFLIARHLARHRVEAWARSFPRFRGVDRAIAEGGWKVVALLRLSPAMPFSAGNYLFGLTGVGFWPYVLASWGAMLPGTLLYVYLGHAGRVAASGGRAPGEWTLLAAGLVATVAVTGYVTRLARRALREEAAFGDEIGGVGTAAGAPPEAPGRAEPKPVGWRLPAAALMAVAVSLGAHANVGRIRSVLGPPAVTTREVYTATPAGVSVDHSILDGVLRSYVDADGLVDYKGLTASRDGLDAYVKSLSRAPFDDLGRDDKLALLINGYNAFTLRLVLEHWPLRSIRDIPEHRRWSDRRWDIAGETMSLDQIEHERIRPRFREPRVHFALVCAARGCPPLRAEAYTGQRLEAQLADQARRVHADPRWLRFDPASGKLGLTALYKWYASDFQQVSGSVAAHVALHVPSLRAALESGRKVEIEWMAYDWSLNAKR